MARYIDADKLIEHIKDEIKACEPVFDGRANGKSVAYGTELGLKAAIAFAETLATADVVPKSEDNIPLDVHEALKQRAKVEVAREIFEEIEKVIGEQYENYVFDNLEIEGVQQDAIIAFADVMKCRLAELKKKYTEGREWTETNI